MLPYDTEIAERSAELVSQNYVIYDDAELIAKSIISIRSELQAAWPEVEALNQCVASVVRDKHLRYRLVANTDGRSHHSNGAEKHSFNSMQRWQDGTVYLELSPYIIGDANTVSAAFALASGSPKLVLDVRTCKGGHPDLVACMLGALLGDSPLHVGDFRRRKERSIPIVTRPGFGAFSGDVVVLTSAKSFSAAESLAYVLQAYGRARIVGEHTAGGANPVSHFSVSDELSLAIPTGSPVFFKTDGNWEGVGVQPDIEISAKLSAQEMVEAMN